MLKKGKKSQISNLSQQHSKLEKRTTCPQKRREKEIIKMRGYIDKF